MIERTVVDKTCNEEIIYFIDFADVPEEADLEFLAFAIF